MTLKPQTASENGFKHLLLIITALMIASCAKEKDELLELIANNPLPPAQTNTPTVPIAIKSQSGNTTRYYYPFSQHRDPFQPLVSAVGGSGAKIAQDPQIIIQNFASLELKGIFMDKEGKIALITSKQGESFILKSGRVFDKRNRKMQGITGIIKDNSVTLFGPNKTIKDLYLRKGSLNG